MQLRFSFQQNQSAVYNSVEDGDPVLCLATTNPLLAGSGQECWQLPGNGQFVEMDGMWLLRSDEYVCGAATATVNDGNLEQAARELYDAMLLHSAGYRVHRFWNFVPRINQAVGELDRYMCFCAGRAQAFATHEHTYADIELPPASAVGTGGDQLCVAFVAGKSDMVPVENPLQVPAYRYPPRYGPRPPSFARAGVVSDGDALFISGTASIRASESLYPADFMKQLETAIENLQAVSTAAQPADWLAPGAAYQRTVRVYVKQPQDWQRHGSGLDQHLLKHAAQFNVIQADICRSELLVEIEAWATRSFC